MTEEKQDEKTAETVADKVEEKIEETKEEIKEEVKEEIKTETPAPVEEIKKDIPAKFKDLISEIDKMSVLDLSEFVKVLEDHYGVTAAAPMVASAGAPATGATAAEVEEKTIFDLVLASAGAQKIQVIKAVREIKPDLGLKEAKDLVDGAPKELLKGAKKEEAEAAKAKLEAAGATVELK